MDRLWTVRGYRGSVASSQCRRGSDGSSPRTRYQGAVYDSDRWQVVELRAGDIVVSTPPKCGTTWTQMILLLLLHQTPELPAPISEMAPWVDHLIRSRGELVDLLEAQPGRRVIKTHTPLDGLPQVAGVTYVCVGRDPRDVARSMDHHYGNLDYEKARADMERAAERDGIELPPSPGMPPRPDDDRERFWAWAENDTPPATAASTLLRTLHHIESFWDVADLDVVLLHYDDLKADLEGEMRRLGRAPRHRGAGGPLARAGGGGHLRVDAQPHRGHHPERRARATGATTSSSSTRASSGQWRELLDDDDLARYRRRIEALTTPEVAAWLHRGDL